MSNADLVSTSEVQSLLQRVDFSQLAGKSMLITGGSGMIGAYLCEVIVRCCDEAGLQAPALTLLVRDSKRRSLAMLEARKEVTIVETSLSTWRSDNKFDYCIHAASPASPTKYGSKDSVIEANVGFLKSISTGRIPSTILFVSSGEVYGPACPEGVTEDFVGELSPASPRSIYPEAKIEAEGLLLELGEQGSTKPIIVRLFHSFGPGVRVDDGRSFADFLWSGAMAQDIKLKSPGKDIRSFLYLEDSIAGILTCLTKGIARETYNVGSDEAQSVFEFATEVGELSGVRVFVDQTNSTAGGQYIHSPNVSIVPSNQKLRGLGWTQQTTLEDGIMRTILWIKQELSEAGRGEN